MNISKSNLAYLAGFLDGDGSIYVRLKPNRTYHYRFQVSPCVVFYQSVKAKLFIERLLSLIERGYLRKRKDGIIEYIIGDEKSITDFLSAVLPYIKLKRKQAKLMLEILQLKKQVRNAKDFLFLAKKIDIFKELNYSKRRIQNSDVVKKVLIDEKLLTP